MKKLHLLYGSIGFIWILGILTYFMENDFMDLVLIYVMISLFSILVFYFMVLPLNNWFFGILGTKHYTINKGKKYASIIPIFKPFFKGSIYDIKITFPENIFDKTIPSNGQINKLFGFNYGLPSLKNKIKTGSPHKNSFRVGFQIADGNIYLYIYKRVYKSIEPMLIYKISKINRKIEFTMDSKRGIFIVDGIEYKSGLYKNWFNYYLPRPYHGGKKPAQRKINLTYNILRKKEK